MHTDANPHRDPRQMPEVEVAHEGQDVQGHAADVHSMSISVAIREPGGDHVSVADGLHLRGDG